MRAVISMGLLAAIATPAVADLPEDGVLIATRTEFGTTGYADHLHVHRVRPTGIDKLYSAKADGAEFGWSDAKTLWVMRDAASKIEIEKIVEGTAAETIAVTGVEWPAAAGKPFDAAMHITTKGEVWLSQCLVGSLVARKGCTGNSTFLRVDVKPFVSSAAKPKQIDAYRVVTIYQGGKPMQFPRAKQPTGYSVKLANVEVDGVDGTPQGRTVKGAICNGPEKTLVTWPEANGGDFAMVPRKTTWLRTSPPLARIEGKAKNPVGEMEDHEAFFLSCSQIVERAEFFGGGVWGWMQRRPVDDWKKSKDPTSDGTWTLFLEDRMLGTVPGTLIRAAPR